MKQCNLKRLTKFKPIKTKIYRSKREFPFLMNNFLRVKIRFLHHQQCKTSENKISSLKISSLKISSLKISSLKISSLKISRHQIKLHQSKLCKQIIMLTIKSSG